MSERKYFHLADDDYFLKLSTKTCAVIFCALIKCKGELHSSMLEGDESSKDGSRLFNALISLPEDQVENFKRLTESVLMYEGTHHLIEPEPAGVYNMGQ